MNDSKRDVPGNQTSQRTLAEDRARLVKLLGRLLAEEWLARQRPADKPAPQHKRGD